MHRPFLMHSRFQMLILSSRDKINTQTHKSIVLNLLYSKEFQKRHDCLLPLCCTFILGPWGHWKCMINNFTGTLHGTQGKRKTDWGCSPDNITTESTGTPTRPENTLYRVSSTLKLSLIISSHPQQFLHILWWQTFKTQKQFRQNLKHKTEINIKEII